LRIVAVRERAVPIASPIRNAFIDFNQMTVSALALISDIERDGRVLVGYGFSSNGRYAQSGLLRDRFIPRLLAAPSEELVDDTGRNFDPHKAWRVLMTNEKPGGHGERSVAVGVIDMALWDLVAKIEDKPLAVLLGERYGSGAPDDRVAVYAAGGYYYPGKNVSALKAEMRGYLDLGYTVVKLKIGGASLDEDLRRIEAVIDTVGNPRSVAVDANGRFELATALAYAEALEPYELRWYEEPGDPLDYALSARLAAAYGPPLATGENLFSMQDARNLVRHAGLRPEIDVLQMDPSLSYGVVEYLRTLAMLEEHGWSRRSVIPHGGHQLALSMAAGLGLGGNESYPHVFQPFGGFADDIPIENGSVALPDVPGIGIETKTALLAVFEDMVADIPGAVAQPQPRSADAAGAAVE
jgi:L-alanine-DL-glutamate epimerase-like enolase superfamily enzyme